MNTDTLIMTANLRKSFHVGTGEIEILKGIDININHGEFVIVFGPSGCGKSTLLHCLLGLEKPSSGRITIDGKDFYAMTDDERALFRRHQVGMVYQQPLWISSFTVLENMFFPLHLLGYRQSIIEAKAKTLLDSVGLTDWGSHKPTELSSGQQQKISLARALMTDPKLIVADEPTGNLDTVSGQELLTTFLKLVEQGRTIIMVTHDLEYLKFANKIFHMIDGLVVEEYTSKHPIKSEQIQGKKEILAGGETSNVRDPNFLKKLGI